MSRAFYLVQRIKHSPWKDKAIEDGKPLDKILRANPFGYGQLGTYDLDYMGSAEFEFGAIPESFARFRKAGKDLTLTEWTYKGHVLDFLYITKNGEPFEDWANWAEGRSYDEYTNKWYDEQPFYGEEKPWELQERLAGKDPHSKNGWRTDVWWALNENVMWAFHEDGHLPRMIESMHTTGKVTLRG